MCAAAVCVCVRGWIDVVSVTLSRHHVAATAPSPPRGMLLCSRGGRRWRVVRRLARGGGVGGAAPPPQGLGEAESRKGGGRAKASGGTHSLTHSAGASSARESQCSQGRERTPHAGSCHSLTHALRPARLRHPRPTPRTPVPGPRALALALAPSLANTLSRR